MLLRQAHLHQMLLFVQMFYILCIFNIIIFFLLQVFILYLIYSNLHTVYTGAGYNFISLCAYLDVLM